MAEYADKKRKMNEELIERLRITEQMLNVAHFKEAESLIREARDAIEELQSKLTASRRLKKGKWIERRDTRFGPKLNYIIICSNCNIAFSGEDMIRRSFCPNCGADMREGNINDQTT